MKRTTALLSVSALAIASAVAAAVYVPSPGLSEAQEGELNGYGYIRRPDPHPQGLVIIDQDYQDRNPDNGVSDGGFPETN